MTETNHGAFRARKESAEREYARRRKLEAIDSKAALADLIARCRDLSTATVDGRSAELERREDRRTRMRDAGIPSPRGGTPQGEAWERVVRATCAADAAMPGHPGSARAMALVEWWQAKGGARSSLAIVGPPGTGKTVASWFAVANAAGMFLPAGDIAPTPRWDETRTRAQRAGLLVVNDAHERMTAWAWAALAELMEARHDTGKRTLLTTNLSRAKLLAGDRLGPRMESRFGPEEHGQGAIIPIDGADIRSMVTR